MRASGSHCSSCRRRSTAQTSLIPKPRGSLPRTVKTVKTVMTVMVVMVVQTVLTVKTVMTVIRRRDVT